jgi:hypothetical protein
MIKHIVMWKLCPLFEGKTKKENAEKIKMMLEKLKNCIPQINKIEVGINFNQSETAYDLVLYSEFLSANDLQIYQQHPEHLKVAEFIAKVKIDRVVADYE